MCSFWGKSGLGVEAGRHQETGSCGTWAVERVTLTHAPGYFPVGRSELHRM